MAVKKKSPAPDKDTQEHEKPLPRMNSNNSSVSTCSSSSLFDTTTTQNFNDPLVTFRATRRGPKCPFGNASVDLVLYPGGCVWLAGNSGAGKTTLSTYLAGLSTLDDLKVLDIECTHCDWNDSIPPSERCGVLFQQTTLLDALTVGGNVSVALQSCPSQQVKATKNVGVVSHDTTTRKIKHLLEAVGLDYARDAPKYPTELSGGMARRASLALQLAQRKRVIILDEPFAGLDREAACGIAKELWHLRHDRNTALLLISHEPELAQIVMKGKGGGETQNESEKLPLQHTATVKLISPTTPPVETATTSKSMLPSILGAWSKHNNMLFGITLWDRFLEKLFDYVVYSLPLIVLTFVACGLAIAMLSADILHRIDVTEKVLTIVDQEIRPLIQMVTGEDQANPLYLMMAKMKVRGMLNTAIPAAKANLYAIGMAKLFVLEIGPLLTALLLCGRIGGSYAGKVATMQATSQTKLLQTLGINPQTWTFVPAMAAAMLASPLLTVVGTWIALWLGAMVGPRYGIGTVESYHQEVWNSIFPTLQIDKALRDANTSGWLTALAVEISTYPPIFHLWKAATFITIVLVVAEVMARLQPNLSPRGVPGVITSSVVIASLLVIVADWGFSQWWIRRL